MIHAVLKKWHVARLQWREEVLIAQLLDKRELIEDHHRRFKVLKRELEQVQREIMLREDPQILLKEVA